ncbi:MAG TPA: hypothetical protein VFW87_08770 [Pirellulales bacterium]|nr:hypothetical protein [Pirellulales bacterium]
MPNPAQAGRENSDEVRRQAWNEIGGSAPGYEDDALAPAVDRPLLVDLIRGQLDPSAAAAVNLLILTFGSWRDAHAELAAAEFRTAPPGA